MFTVAATVQTGNRTQQISSVLCFSILASGGKQQNEGKVTSLFTSFVYLLVATTDKPCVALKVISPKFINGVFPQLVEFDLLREDIKRYVNRSPQPPATLVIVQDGVEAGTVPIEEVFVPEWVEVPDPPGRVTQQRVRELVQRPKLSLEPQAAHL